MFGTSSSAGASTSSTTQATVAIPYREGPSTKELVLEGRPGYPTGSLEGVLHVLSPKLMTTLGRDGVMGSS